MEIVANPKQSSQKEAILMNWKEFLSAKESGDFEIWNEKTFFDLRKGYIFVGLKCLTDDILKIRRRLIAKSKPGQVPIWYLVLPGINKEQENELEAFWLNVVVAPSIEEIEREFGVDFF